VGYLDAEALFYLRSRGISEKESRLLLMNEIEKDNKRLRDILNFRSLYYASRLIPVEIIARTGSNWFEIIEINKGIVVVKRSNPPYGWALPGGFVDYGESLEKAVAREAKEETGLAIKGLKQFHTYSDPKRDPRFHTVGTVFIAKAKGRPKAGDDAAGIKVINLKEIASLEFAFDHKSILKDYIRYKTQTRRFC
jgi:ADP-ribose pyrophosphatase YjhB (NUDIX family)